MCAEQIKNPAKRVKGNISWSMKCLHYIQVSLPRRSNTSVTFSPAFKAYNINKMIWTEHMFKVLGTDPVRRALDCSFCLPQKILRNHQIKALYNRINSSLQIRPQSLYFDLKCHSGSSFRTVFKCDVNKEFIFFCRREIRLYW